MASVKTLVYLGLCVTAWTITAADQEYRAGNVRWISLDFKTMLTWTTKEPHHKYSVRYSEDGGDWSHHQHCDKQNGTICDMSNEIVPDKRDKMYTADVISEPDNPGDSDYDEEDFRHTESKPFNPYKESNISAVVFSVHALEDRSVILNITDTLTGWNKDQKQLTIRDVFRRDLKYKIRYFKSETTRQKENTSDTSMATVSKLDPGESYCFIVAAYIESRPKNTQMGEWSKEKCVFTQGARATELSVGAMIGVIFILLTVLIIVITVIVLCCRNREQRTNKSLQTTQSVSTPV